MLLAWSLRLLAVLTVSLVRRWSLTAIVTTAATAGTLCRLGIYGTREATHEFYPDKLLFQTGDSDATCVPSSAPCNVGQGPSFAAPPASSGAPVNLVLSSDVTYWFVILCNATTTLRCFNTAGASWTFGADGALATFYNALRKSQGYGSLPTTFPTTPTSGASAPQFVQLPCLPVLGVTFP